MSFETARGAVEVFRRGVGFVVAIILAEPDDDPAAAANITSGSGAPSDAQPDGSLYLRTDGADGDDSLYMRIGGSWVAIQGQTA